MDNSANLYLAATTASDQWKATSGSLHPGCTAGLPPSCPDVIVVKLDPSVTKPLYVTYLGGSGIDQVSALAVDGAGNAYLTGSTNSDDFPITSGAFQKTRKPRYQTSYSGFLTKLSANGGKLLFSTYFDPPPNALALDGAGNAYIAGAATSTPPLLDAIQSAPYNFPCQTPSFSGLGGQSYCGNSGFVAAFENSGNLLWSTYIGGGTSVDRYGSSNAAAAITTDRSGNIYVAGSEIAITTAAVNGSTSNDAAVVKIAPGGDPPQITGITTSAGFHVGLPAPGGLASLFVTGLNLTGTLAASSFPVPTELAGVSIFIDGAPAPILSVSGLPNLPAEGGTQQINFQVPYEVPRNTDIQARIVELRFKGQSAFAEPQYVAPGLFTTADGGPIVQHAADYSLVSATNPIRRGEIVILYGTGFGPVVPTAISGAAAPGAAGVQAACGYPTINLGDVLYVGLTPGFAGLYQLNVRVSDSLTPGALNVGVDWPHCWPMPIPQNLHSSNTVDVPIQ